MKLKYDLAAKQNLDRLKIMKNKIAYLILAHGDPNHFAKLVTALGHNCDVYAHIDEKVKNDQFENVVNHKAVCFIRDKVSVCWGGISMIDAYNLLFNQVIKKKEEYSHLVMLSGSCYPIKKISSHQKMMTNSPDKEFIKYIDMRESPDHYMKQVQQKRFREPLIKSNNRIISFADKAIRKILRMLKLKNNWDRRFVPYYGSCLFAITPACCEYLMNFQRENPWYYEMNFNTTNPDEHYFHTLIGNSKYAEKADGLNDFEGRGLWRMANLHIIHPSLSKWYTVNDWQEITGSDMYFVRKVRSQDGSELVNEIDSKILA